MQRVKLLLCQYNNNIPTQTLHNTGVAETEMNIEKRRWRYR